MCEEENVTSRKCEVKERVYEVSLGQKGRSSEGKGGRGLRSYGPQTSQILGTPGTGSVCIHNVSKSIILVVF